MMALDELYPEPLLQLLDLGTQGGLADETALCRLAEVPRFSQCDQIAQIA